MKKASDLEINDCLTIKCGRFKKNKDFFMNLLVGELLVSNASIFRNKCTNEVGWGRGGVREAGKQ